MNSQATIVILAEPTAVVAPGAEADPLQAFSTLDTLLRRVLAADLPMLLVATPEQAQAALSLVPQNDILITAPTPPLNPQGDGLARSLSAAIMARSLSPGWVVVPGDMPMLQIGTLQHLSRQLNRSPIVYPSHRHLRGQPVAFASELYSELVRLQTEHDLRRLVARYPALDVEVADPGIHLNTDRGGPLDHWRAQLGGPFAGQGLALGLASGRQTVSLN